MSKILAIASEGAIHPVNVRPETKGPVLDRISQLCAELGGALNEYDNGRAQVTVCGSKARHFYMSIELNAVKPEEGI